ncbi:M20/M25/M40 family metallo-hydrolase [Desulfonatronovibrio magnus]|uniref:M20/M25/M40 family metallo-hydrolase n=1 Tax=Desulfonatronovibrio magnus TaxID=698827 RepID=UPI0018DDAB68|nr:M20/M25/M40 family metallo-hydrolase [Desulfonatronovibrio magnus]
MDNNLTAHIQGLQDEMFSLLEKLVLIQSGTGNKSGIDRMADLLEKILAGISLNTEILPMQGCGNMLSAWTDKALEAPHFLLVGHMDTVFPFDSPFNFYREDDVHAYGPGVMDMKGGLVVGIFALKALSDMGLLKDIPVKIFFNSDEEIGSPYSKAIIEKEAVDCKAAFVLEGGGLGSEVVVARKGKIGLKVVLSGQAGHAGAAGIDKPSALLEAAHKIIALENLNSPPDILINVGAAHGGMVPNAIAEKAELLIDIRYAKPQDEQQIIEAVDKICEQSVVHGVTGKYNIVSNRPPMKLNILNEALYVLVKKVAEKYSLPIGSETRGGVSDANFIAAMSIPVLDGLGPCGDLDHSDKEYIIKETMGQRTLLLAGSLLDLNF